LRRARSESNGIDIEVCAADYRRLRGLTFIAAIADEVAFWSSDYSANPDDEILNAVRPGLATTGGPLSMISSPYARRGELWRVFQRHYGAAGDPLIMVAKGSSSSTRRCRRAWLTALWSETPLRLRLSTALNLGVTSRVLSALRR
jgi:hypothetical protein